MAERTFTDVLEDLDEGKVIAQCTKFIRDLAKQVADTGKAGSLTLKIKAKLDGRIIVLTAEPKVTLPQAATGSTFFYLTEGSGDLTRDDPKQPQLRGLEAKPPTPLKSVKAPEPTTDNPKGA